MHCMKMSGEAHDRQYDPKVAIMSESSWLSLALYFCLPFTDSLSASFFTNTSCTHAHIRMRVHTYTCMHSDTHTHTHTHFHVMGSERVKICGQNRSAVVSMELCWSWKRHTELNTCAHACTQTQKNGTRNSVKSPQFVLYLNASVHKMGMAGAMNNHTC
jgi:hypothetical protein